MATWMFQGPQTAQCRLSGLLATNLGLWAYGNNESMDVNGGW